MFHWFLTSSVLLTMLLCSKASEISNDYLKKTTQETKINLFPVLQTRLPLLQRLWHGEDSHCRVSTRPIPLFKRHCLLRVCNLIYECALRKCWVSKVLLLFYPAGKSMVWCWCPSPCLVPSAPASSPAKQTLRCGGSASERPGVLQASKYFSGNNWTDLICCRVQIKF